MNAREFLEEKRILIKDAKTFPINLSRDTHIKTANNIIQAMEEYAELVKNHGVSHSVIKTKQRLAMQMIETERRIEDIRKGGVGDNDDALIAALIGKYERYEDEYNSL